MNMKNRYLSIIWFVLGFAIFMTSRASRFIPYWSAGVIVAPVFVLAFSRTLTRKRGGWLILIGFLLSCNVAMWRLFEMETSTMTIIFNIIRNSLIGFLFTLPYLAERSLYQKIQKHGAIWTLSFPIAQTAVLFLVSLESPFDGDMISAVYSAFGGIVSRQVASVTGLFGFVFIYSWFAAVINYILEKRFQWKRINSVLISMIIVVSSITLFGVIKSTIPSSSDKTTVKAAAIIMSPKKPQNLNPEVFFSKKPSDYKMIFSRIEFLTEEAASEGAKIIAFQESALKILEADEERMINDLSIIASSNKVYLSIGYGVFPLKEKGWNKAVLINDSGEILIDYRKRYLLGFGDIGETLIYNKGPEIIQTADTPYGKIGLSICRDMSFPRYARQAGRENVDIMLNPSYDIPKSGGEMYSLRAVENGFSMIRPVFNGYSYAVDSHGKLLASMDSDQSLTGIMYADIPISGNKTLYIRTGDLLGWLSVLGLIAFWPLGTILKRKVR